jgi:hypothetical protein
MVCCGWQDGGIPRKPYYNAICNTKRSAFLYEKKSKEESAGTGGERGGCLVEKRIGLAAAAKL